MSAPLRASSLESSARITRRQQREQQHQQHHLLATTNSYFNLNYLKIVLIFLVCHLVYISQVSCQLPDDIQRELNQNLAEQARLQAMRARHQQQIQARQSGAGAGGSGQPKQAAGVPATRPAHDPNNYSFQQVSPPIQYSYYQPYGDLANQQQPQQAGGQQAAPVGQTAAQQPPINIDLNNLNIDLPNMPTPQAQVAPQTASPQQRAQHMTPHFTGVAGLPVLQPVAAANQSPDSFAAPVGQAPLQPQAQTAGNPQQGPPLTEADFKDITGGENYGAPGGTDFGMAANQGGGSGNGDQASEPRSSSGDSDAQLREFGMPDGQSDNNQQQQQAPQQRQDNSMAGMMQDLGGFNPMASSAGNNQGQSRRRQGNGGGFDPFGSAGFGGGGGGFPLGNDFGGAFGSAPSSSAPARRQSQPASGGDFDFASQPSSQSQGGSSGAGDPAQGALNGGAPGSLQSLLGNAFPGLGGGSAGTMGLDELARGNNAPESQLDDQRARPQRADDGSLDIADLGDRADGFSGADLGGFEQPTPQNDQDYNYAAAAEHQPKSVPYPDGGPQFVGTLWALGQPQSLTQNRYNPLPDKGTYQDYPAYQSGGNDFGAVAQVVDETPRARRAGPGRYSQPSPNALAPEHRYDLAANQQYDYGRGPLATPASDGYSSSSLSRDFDDATDDDFVD